MKHAILLFAVIGILTTAMTVDAQTVGLNVLPPSTSTGGREAMVISYTGLEDSEVALFESVLPATTEADCLATKDFANLVPIPAERTYQTSGEGRKVVIVFTKTYSYGPCHVIVGRNGLNLDDFSTVRANFGSTLFFGGKNADRTAGMAPKFHLIRHTGASPGVLP